MIQKDRLVQHILHKGIIDEVKTNVQQDEEGNDEARDGSDEDQDDDRSEDYDKSILSRRWEKVRHMIQKDRLVQHSLHKGRKEA